MSTPQTIPIPAPAERDRPARVVRRERHVRIAAMAGVRADVKQRNRGALLALADRIAAALGEDDADG